MIGLLDASLLAATKLKTRRIRTIITVFISGLLFALLIATLIIAEGSRFSIGQFGQEGLNDRYIVATSPDQPNAATGIKDPAVIKRSLELHEEIIVAKKAEAERLNISYNESSEILPVVNLPARPGMPEVRQLNIMSPAATQALQEYARAHPNPDLSVLKEITASYHPKTFYTSTIGGPQYGTLTTMRQGKENFVVSEGNMLRDDPLHAVNIEKVDPELLQPFLFNDPPQRDMETIPIVISHSRAIKLLGMTPLASSATASQKLRQIKELYEKAPTITIEACYRNTVSMQQIRAAISQDAEIAKNKDNKGYQKPSLMYGLPSPDSCGQATILSDTRTSQKKKADAAQDEFDRRFGRAVDPTQQKLVFQVVGLTPGQGSETTTTTGDILAKIVGSSLNDTIMIPVDQLNALSNTRVVNDVLFSANSDNPLALPPTIYYAEFSRDTDARNFINDKSCTTGPSGRCATPEKPFNLRSYGSNSIALEDMQRQFNLIFTLAALVIGSVALIVMGGTVGRMITDGRRESAVFRAIGAKRIDIAITYSIYTFCLSLFTALFALAAGIAVAYGFDKMFWESTTVQAQLLFGATDTGREFHFFTLTPVVGVVALGVLGCGFLSMVVPLMRNVRRNPINDMREE